MPIWKCEFCSRELETELEPEQCPCGSDMIAKEEKLSRVEKLMQKYIGSEDNQARS